MIISIVALVVFGLNLGSFVNAWVWRVHEQEHETEKKKPSKKYLKDLSIVNGRSMCPNCHHILGTMDLFPLFSWLFLKGKCRYCKTPISAQYPAVEVITAGLFVLSYLYWPQTLTPAQDVSFIVWLILLTGFMALIIYDLRWMLLPNRIIYPLGVIAVVYAIVNVVNQHNLGRSILLELGAAAIGGGIFFVIFMVSDKLIGYGDVRLGWILGLLVATPQKAILYIFLASVAGSVISIPFLASKRLKANSRIPFGPFLILGAILAVLFGGSMLHWYSHLFLASV